MFSTFKDLIRQNALIYEPIRLWRSYVQERAYVQLRAEYWQRLPHVTEQATRPLTTAIYKPSMQCIRIFVVVAHDWEHRTLTPVLKRDFDTIIFDYGDYVSASCGSTSLTWRRDLQRDLLSAFFDAHSQKPIDLVFAYGSHTHFDPLTLQSMRHAAPVALMCLDDKHAFASDPRYKYPNGQKPLIGAADVHLTNSLECVRWYQAEGADALYFPEGCNPDLGNELNLEKIYDVTFVGRNYGVRGKFVQQLQKSGIRVECFGPGWPNGPVSDEDMLRVSRQSWISLGFGAVGFSGKITCLKARDLDVPATGSVYLTTYDPELARMFDIGKEILCYRTEIDAVEQILYYLDHKDELMFIGEAARERCIRQHTWTHRMMGLLQWLGIV